MTTRKTPPHRDIGRPIDHRFKLTQLGRLSVWMIFDGDVHPFAEIHLNERGSRSRSPRLVEACSLFVLAGESYDFVEAIARMRATGKPEEVLAALVDRARDLVHKKEQFSL
jgi:hypothetical protein